MTRLRQVVLGSAAAALFMGGAISQGFAEEAGSFTNYLGGATIGIPAGAAPPPGLYTGLEMVYPLAGPAFGNQGGNVNPNASTLKIGATIGIVPLVWSTGYNILGGNLTVAAVQAFYTAIISAAPNNTNGCSPASGVCAVSPNVANTSWGASLSWNLGGGWFTSLGIAFEAPDGSAYVGSPNPDYWSVQPQWNISYLANNWVLSANNQLFFNGASRGNCCGLGAAPAAAPGNGYTGGDLYAGDYTALYKFGKWSIGPVGYVYAQVSPDRPGGGFTCGLGVGQTQCGNLLGVAAGGLVGYDFGPVDLQVWVTDQFVTRDDPGGGLSFWSRIGFRLWAPEAPKPLVAKN